MHKWKAKLQELFGIDIRSLAVFRIGLALIILGDLYIRLQDLSAHYSDEGVLPREVLINQLSDSWMISLHLLHGAWQFQLALFILEALFAIALLVGYCTRLATALSWIFLISLQARNPIILQGGDVVLRLLLFWTMFLPLGACWSVDSRLRAGLPTRQIVSGGTIGLLLQICFIYWFAALLKTDDSWTKDGTAVWQALNIEQYSTPFGLYLLQFPDLLKIVTFSTLYLEAFGPFFAFSPFWTAPLRLITVVVFISFHLLGLNLAMELGLFCYVCSVAWIVFIPGCVWDRLSGKQSVATSTWQASMFSNVLAGMCISYIFMWNVVNLNLNVYWSDNLDSPGLILRVDQFWNMFSPYPLEEDGWFLIPGRLRDGSEVDLYDHGGPISWKKPELVSAMYKNDRWRSFMMNLYLDEDNEVYIRQYAHYLCRQWDQRHPPDKQLINFDIVFMLKRAKG